MSLLLSCTHCCGRQHSRSSTARPQTNPTDTENSIRESQSGKAGSLAAMRILGRDHLVLASELGPVDCRGPCLRAYVWSLLWDAIYFPRGSYAIPCTMCECPSNTRPVLAARTPNTRSYTSECPCIVIALRFRRLSLEPDFASQSQGSRLLSYRR